MAEIDRLMAKAPAAPAKPAPGPGALPGRVAEAPVATRPPRGGALSAWFRVLLGVVLAGAMTQWPYAAACGPQLFLYVGACAIVSLAGIWGAAASWRRRMVVAHVLALLVTLWGLVLLATIVLPRIGYARAEAAWFCP